MIRRENIRLTISNVIFHLEKGDYEMLSSYLRKAQRYYHSLPNGQKQFEDFEFAISEFLLDRLKDGEPNITTEHILEARTLYGSFLKTPKIDKGYNARETEKKNTDVQSFGTSISPNENFQKVIMAALSILGLSF